MIRLTKKNNNGDYEFDFGILSSKGWSKQDLINYIAHLENARDKNLAEAEMNVRFAMMRMEQEKMFSRGNHLQTTYYDDILNWKYCGSI